MDKLIFSSCINGYSLSMNFFGTFPEISQDGKKWLKSQFYTFSTEFSTHMHIHLLKTLRHFAQEPIFPNFTHFFDKGTVPLHENGCKSSELKFNFYQQRFMHFSAPLKPLRATPRRTPHDTTFLPVIRGIFPKDLPALSPDPAPIRSRGTRPKQEPLQTARSKTVPAKKPLILWAKTHYKPQEKDGTDLPD